MKRAAFTTLILLTFLNISFSQSNNLQQKIKGFRNSKKFIIQYDKFKDYTIITVGPFATSGTTRLMATGSMYFMSAHFGFKGQEMGDETSPFFLTFDHSGKEWGFLKNRELDLLVDGERLNLGEGRHDGKVGMGGVSERLLFELSPAMFSKIANAKTVELRVGNYQTQLKDEHLQAFRDLYELSGSKP